MILLVLCQELSGDPSSYSPTVGAVTFSATFCCSTKPAADDVDWSEMSDALLRVLSLGGKKKFENVRDVCNRTLGRASLGEMSSLFVQIFLGLCKTSSASTEYVTRDGELGTLVYATMSVTSVIMLRFVNFFIPKFIFSLSWLHKFLLS